MVRLQEWIQVLRGLFSHYPVSGAGERGSVHHPPLGSYLSHGSSNLLVLQGNDGVMVGTGFANGVVAVQMGQMGSMVLLKWRILQRVEPRLRKLSRACARVVGRLLIPSHLLLGLRVVRRLFQ